jgi:hypothetical protein
LVMQEVGISLTDQALKDMVLVLKHHFNNI